MGGHIELPKPCHIISPHCIEIITYCHITNWSLVLVNYYYYYFFERIVNYLFELFIFAV